MESATTPYRSLNIFYPKNDSLYKEIEQLIKQPNITKLLQDNYINVYTLMREDINKLIIHLNDFNMVPIATFNELNEMTIKTILDLCGTLHKPNQGKTATSVQGGGKTNYKYKYEKYKTKCDMMKGVITKMH